MEKLGHRAVAAVGRHRKIRRFHVYSRRKYYLYSQRKYYIYIVELDEREVIKRRLAGESIKIVSLGSAVVKRYAVVGKGVSHGYRGLSIFSALLQEADRIKRELEEMKTAVDSDPSIEAPPMLNWIDRRARLKEGRERHKKCVKELAKKLKKINLTP